MHPITRIDELSFDPNNARTHNERNLGVIADSLRAVGAARSIVIDENGTILAGNGTVEAARQAGLHKIAVIEADGDTLIAVRRTGLTAEQKIKLALFDNRSGELAEWDAERIEELIADGVDLSDLWDESELDALLLGTDSTANVPDELSGESLHESSDELPDESSNLPLLSYQKGSLAERFTLSPFSVLDARSGAWQKQRERWLTLGIASELGRDENITYASSSQPTTVYNLKNTLRAALGREPSWDEVHEEAERRGIKTLAGTSIFDPFLCEVLYAWFCPPNGAVLDPFAGGSVRGVVAAEMGYSYTGFDIRAEQINANYKQLEIVYPSSKDATHEKRNAVKWFERDIRESKKTLGENAFDFVFSCPPYFDCEVYSDQDDDLSNQSWENFQQNYAEIIRVCCEALDDDCFACFVVGDVRDKQGNYRNFPELTTKLFQENGLTLYNEAVFITPYGSLPIRVGRQFETSRKLGKTHQNVLVYLKGNARAAAQKLQPKQEL